MDVSPEIQKIVAQFTEIGCRVEINQKPNNPKVQTLWVSGESRNMLQINGQYEKLMEAVYATMRTQECFAVAYECGANFIVLNAFLRADWRQ